LYFAPEKNIVGYMYILLF